MTLTFCKIFHTIVQQGSFVKTAEILNMTPSAVSHATKDAEASIGFQIFNRTKNGITLTESGAELYPAVLQILNGESVLAQTIDQLRGLEKGTAKIGIFNSTCTNWMPDIIKIFSKQYPDISIEIYEGGYDDVIYWIKTGIVEFGFLSTTCTSELVVEPLYRDPLICIVPPEFKTKSEGVITIEEMKGQQFVIQREGSDADVQVMFDKYGLTFQAKCHVLDDTSVMSLIACGQGMSVMPKLTAKGLEGNLKVLRIEPDECRIIGLSSLNKKLLSPAAKQLYKCIVDYVSKLPESIENVKG